MSHIFERREINVLIHHQAAANRFSIFDHNNTTHKMLAEILARLPRAPARFIWNAFWWFMVIVLTTVTASLVYAAFYWLFIPIKAHVRPVYLQYRCEPIVSVIFIMRK